MKNIPLLFIAFLLLQFILFSQTPDTLWTKVYGGVNFDLGYSIQPTSDGGYIIVGYTESFGLGSTDIWLLKTDSNGDTIWTKTYGNFDEEEGWNVLETTNGEFIICGQTKSFGAGEEDLWLIKTSSDGDTLWTKTYGGFDDDKFFVLRKSMGQGYVILGQTRSFGEGLDDLWLLKIDANGDTLWTKTYGDSLDNDVGSIEATSDSGYIITGTSEVNSAGENDIWLIKTNQVGDTLWTKKFGGYSSERVTPNSVRQTADGGYIIFASSESFGAGGEDVWLIKTNENGDTLWTRTYGGAQDDVSICGHQLSDGGYIILARTQSLGAGQQDIWIIKTDPIGNFIWTKILGGQLFDVGASIQCTTEGGYVIIGATASFALNGIDLWLICLETDSTTSAEEISSIPADYRLFQNYPNPFNPRTRIKYQIPNFIASGTKQSQLVILKVYDVLGNEVATLVNEKKPSGTYEITWQAANLPSGVYFYRLRAVDPESGSGQVFVETKKMVLIK